MSITERSKEPEPTREKVAAEYRDHAAIRVCDDELWELNVGHNAVQSGRQAGRDRIAPVRRRSQWRPDPSAVEEARRQFEREREAKAKRLARMGRIVIHSTGAGWNRGSPAIPRKAGRQRAQSRLLRPRTSRALPAPQTESTVM